MRLATIAFRTHVALIGASVLAFQLVVHQPAPAGFDADLWAAAYQVGMQVTGPLYILTGFLAALGLAWSSLGVRRGSAAAAVVVALTLGLELLGTATGFPFGPYRYGDSLGPKIAGLVPIVIPLSWFLMTYASLGAALRFRLGRAGTTLLTAGGLLAWDLLMDPAMSAVFPFWIWHTGGVYYGMPLANWFGWLLTGALASLGVQWVAGPSRTPAITAQPMPLVLYAVNGLFPLALALQAGLYVPGVAGGSAMALYLAGAVVAGSQRWRHRTLALGRL
jgi:putative membrane protein